MKLSTLLAQYLYAQKQLSLPGLGRFLLIEEELPPAETAKNSKQASASHITFTADTQIKEVPELVSFIAAQSGKIKALAAADLESHLELAHQFLNIGKPFLLEGIGTLEKKQSGEFVFTTGAALPVMLKEPGIRESKTTAEQEEVIPDYKSVFYQSKKPKSAWKKPVAIVLMLLGLALAIWGGYTVYKRTTARNSQPPPEPVKEETAVIPDTTKQVTTAPPVPVQPAQPVTVTAPAGNYKFVIETAVKERALTRFARLKAFGLDIKMETPDSASFKLFFLLPAQAADTARMVDSLRQIYTPAWSRAYVEN